MIWSCYHCSIFNSVFATRQCVINTAWALFEVEHSLTFPEVRTLCMQCFDCHRTSSVVNVCSMTFSVLHSCPFQVPSPGSMACMAYIYTLPRCHTTPPPPVYMTFPNHTPISNNKGLSITPLPHLRSNLSQAYAQQERSHWTLSLWCASVCLFSLEMQYTGMLLLRGHYLFFFIQFD